MSKIYIIIVFSAIATLCSCKGSTTPDGNNNNNNNGNTTPQSIGDTIPGKNSGFTFDFDLLTTQNQIEPGYPNPGFYTYCDTTGLSIFSKNSVFRIIDDANDTAYFTYESNGDVSIYFENPGYFQIYHNPVAPINEPLREIVKKVFAQWITFPIASKTTNTVLLNSTGTPITISAGTRAADIHATIGYIGDSSVTISGKNFTEKVCRITISAAIRTKDQGSQIDTLTHTRTFWFVPKLGYFAKLETRSDMQAYDVDVIPRDTTSVLKVLTKYQLY